MLALLLLVLTALAFCAIAVAMLWKDWPGKQRGGLHRLVTRVSALRFPTFSRASRGRAALRGVDAWQIRWGDQKSADVEIAVVELSARPSLRQVPLRPAAKESISDFVLGVARAFGEQDGVRVLRMAFSPEVASQLRSGKLDRVRGAIGKKPLAFDPGSGKIREIGGVAEAVNASAAISLAWEAECYVTARRFLADIDRSCRFVSEHIAEVTDLFVEQHQAQLNASHRYMLQVSVSAGMGNLSPEESVVAGNELETIERQTASAIFLAQTEMYRRITELRETHEPEQWTPNHLVQAIKSELSYFAQLEWVALLALQTRGAATHLRVALPLNKDAAPGRAQALSEDLARCRQLHREFFKKIDSTAENIDEINKRQPVIDDSKARVKAFIEEVESSLSDASGEVEKALARVEKAVKADPGSKPLEILATVDQGAVTLAVDEDA